MVSVASAPFEIWPDKYLPQDLKSDFSRKPKPKSTAQLEQNVKSHLTKQHRKFPKRKYFFEYKKIRCKLRFIIAGVINYSGKKQKGKICF